MIHIRDKAPTDAVGRILVPCPADDSNAEMDALRTALALAHGQNSSVVAAFLRPDPALIARLSGAEIGMQGMVAASEAARHKFDHDKENARRLLADACSVQPGMPKMDDAGQMNEVVRFYSAFGKPSEAMLGLSRTCDFSIFPLSEEGPPDEVGHDCLMESGHPVLFVPPAWPSRLPERVLIAWNGSRQAARAVTAAIGLISDALRVHIVQIGPPVLPAADTGSLAEYLAVHGIAASTETCDANPGAVASTLLERVDDYGCDLVVQGAYSHAPLTERIFGGVTRSVLASTRVPTFMVH